MYTLSRVWQIITFTLLFALSTPTPAITCVFDEIFEDAEVSKLYRINSETSHVTFHVDSSIGQVEGAFESFYGGISLSPHGRGEGLTAFVIQADTLSTSNGFIEGILRGDSFFDVERYKDIVFVSRDFTWVNNTNAILTGELTIRDITHIISFTITFAEAGTNKINITARTYIDREAFGMDSLSSIVENDVELVMSVEATKYR